MTELEGPEISGYTIFCDDLRFETDGKITLVGSYYGVMVIRGGFPATLPKFAISAAFVQSKMDWEKKLRLKMFLPGDPADEPSIVVEVDPTPEIAGSESVRPNIAVRANIIFAPLIINSPGLIKVRMERRGQLHPIGTLEVVDADATSSATPPPSSQSL